MNTTATIREMKRGDEVYATLVCNGRTLANVRATEFGSLDEIVGYIYATTRVLGGLARLTVRNRTQGWSVIVPLSRQARRPLVA
ncbi:MAG: hypothetical protein II786_03760 [Muribaculaceae bacterium]|nr:hypothetical protein [Muribaculaceae bacterium]